MTKKISLHQLKPEKSQKQQKIKKIYCEDEDKGGEAELFHSPDSVAGPFTFSSEPKQTHAAFHIPA